MAALAMEFLLEIWCAERTLQGVGAQHAAPCLLLQEKML
jgi:hypothetical protein